MFVECEVLIMKVNATDFTAGTYRVPTVPLGQKKNIAPINHNTKLKRTDIIPVTGLLGATVMSFYLIRKGNLDVGVRAIHF